MIRKAIKNVFNVNPVKINVMKVRGRWKRVRYKYGYTASWKKAIVTLESDYTLELFDHS
jgi:large subunit ribosomal protein L23